MQACYCGYSLFGPSSWPDRAASSAGEPGLLKRLSGLCTVCSQDSCQFGSLVHCLASHAVACCLFLNGLRRSTGQPLSNLRADCSGLSLWAPWGSNGLLQRSALASSGTALKIVIWRAELCWSSCAHYLYSCRMPAKRPIREVCNSCKQHG